MGFLTSLFGGEAGSWWGVGFALVIVLVLIVAALWALKLLFNASGSVTRGRQRRLAVIDTLSIDGKHNLVLVRRDNVEHLMVIGGTQNVVVETGISTETPEPVRGPRAQVAAPAAGDAAKPPAPATQSPEGRRAAASRLGLTGLIRRYNAPQADTGNTSTEPGISPLERLKSLGQPEPQQPAPRLRHTGLLRPASHDEDASEPNSAVEDPQNSAPETSDSAMNGFEEHDAGAAAHDEDGMAAEDVGNEHSDTEVTGDEPADPGHDSGDDDERDPDAPRQH